LSQKLLFTPVCKTPTFLDFFQIIKDLDELSI
jgi:hypothetical protein